jgi:hypothetical protein
MSPALALISIIIGTFPDWSESRQALSGLLIRVREIVLPALSDAPLVYPASKEFEDSKATLLKSSLR